VRDALAAHGCDPRESGASIAFRCPCHDDRRASGSLSEGDDGRALVCCHAGCDGERIVETIGLAIRDLFADGPRNETRRTERPPSPAKPEIGAPWYSERISAVYDYHDAEGNVIYRVCRTPNKAFPVARRDAASPTGWYWGQGDVSLVLYRLPEVIEAVASGRTIYFVEGEKDADAILAHYAADPDRSELAPLIAATTSPGGAERWHTAYADALRGAAQVVVVADRDEPGRLYAWEVAYSCAQRAIRNAVVEAATGKDASDHLAAGHGLDDFVRIPHKDAATGHQGDRGSRVREPGDAGDEQGEPAQDGGELDLVRLVREGITPKPVPYLLCDSNGQSAIMDGDIIVAAGEGESGKSTFVLGLALSLSTGIDFAGRFQIAEPVPVLYYDGENNERLIERRWLRLVNGTDGARDAVLGWDTPRFRYRWRGGLTLDTTPGRDFIVARCLEYGSRALVLDTQIRFTAGDLTQGRDAANIYAHLSEIKRRAGLRLIVMLAHLRKRAGKDGVNDLGQRVYGSVDIRNSCDCLLILTKPADGVVTIIHDKTRWDAHYPAFDVALTRHGGDGPEGRDTLVASTSINTPANTINTELDKAAHDGRLRQELIDAVLRTSPNLTPEAARKATDRELESRSYASRREGKPTRYWLRPFAPEGAA